MENKKAKNSGILQIKPLITEKAVMLIESQNVMTFRVDKDSAKDKIKKEVEEMFNVKVEKIRIMNRGTNKYAYVKLNPKTPAIDIATKLGMI